MAIQFTRSDPKPTVRKDRTVAPKRGGRPKSANPKVALNIRVDADVLARFKATGKGWQARVNEVLRAASDRL